MNALKLNKKSVVKLHLFEGRPPKTHKSCGGSDVPSDELHEWFTDAAERLCETFDGTGCF
ncbi:MAG: hypothetical protein AAF611_08100 [Bacteroidota bacterium]